MRTTLEIDDEVLLAAKDIAQRKHNSVGAVISDSARQALTGAVNVNPAFAEPAGFYGFQPLPAEGREVSNDVVEKFREDEGL